MNASEKLEELRKLGESRVRHRELARMAAEREKQLVLELEGLVSVAELARVSGRSRSTINNWRFGLSGDVE